MTTFRPYIAAAFLGLTLGITFMVIVCLLYPVS